MNNENLEKRKPFEKGDPRINREGRPVGVKNRSTIVKQWLEATKIAKNPISEMEEEMQVQDMITLALISKALKGDVAAFKELMDSGYGKVPNNVEDDNNDKEIKLTIEVVDPIKDES